MLKGVIFDMDGVLINSEPVHFKAYQSVLKEVGIELSYELYRPLIGSTRKAVANMIKMNYPVSLTESEINNRADAMKKRLNDENGFARIPGVYDLIKGIHQAGIKLAVASSSPYEYILKALQEIEIYSFFDQIISGESVACPKPAPDIFIKALDKLSLEAEACLVVEDSYNGVTAAKSAGIACIGFHNPDSGEQDLWAADYVVEGFEEINENFLRQVHKQALQEKAKTVTETKRLTIRESIPEDVKEFIKLSADQEVKDWVTPLSGQAEEEQKMKKYQKYQYGFYGYGIWTIVLKETGQVVGRAGIEKKQLDGQTVYELSYMVGKEFQRNGYAYEACKEIISYAQDDLEIKRLHAVIHEKNRSSINLIQKLGFKPGKKITYNNDRCILYHC